MAPDSDDATLAEQLFQAARGERPAPGVKPRVVRSLSARPPLPKQRWLLVALALGGAAVLLVARAFEFVQQDAEVEGERAAIRAEPIQVAPGSVAVPSRSKPVVVRGKEAIESVTPVASAAPPSSVVAPRRSAAANVPAASLEQELQMLDAARQALLGGDTGAALERLAHYDRAATRRHLGAEATVLRIQILAASGRGSEASALASQFVAKHPNSPLVDRAKSFVSEPINRSEGP